MVLPKVIPINELKNTAQISKTCEESDVPIVITKNGYGKMVLMSVDLYEREMAEAELAGLINEAVEDEENGAPWIDGDELFASMREKYGEPKKEKYGA
ncbi:MAG: type II toxin-antitoxin system Phd/YefM family antitoxin [Oscillospiraceae bacterium]|nr:type II toxin-antitoxin system Phd/YefM family antitoxin [Oscillospiraceae bacterium]